MLPFLRIAWTAASISQLACRITITTSSKSNPCSIHQINCSTLHVPIVRRGMESVPSYFEDTSRSALDTGLRNNCFVSSHKMLSILLIHKVDETD